MRRSFTVVLAAGFLGGCDGVGGKNPPAGERPLFTEVTAAVGLSDSRGVWPDGRYQIPEISTGGLALLDHDGDGDLDLRHVGSAAMVVRLVRLLSEADGLGELLDGRVVVSFGEESNALGEEIRPGLGGRRGPAAIAGRRQERKQ